MENPNHVIKKVLEVSCGSYSAIHTLQGILLDYPRYPTALYPANRLCFVVLIE